MKILLNRLMLLSLLTALGLSCTDEEKDPFLFDQVAKGTILALRNGDSQDNFFIKNAPSGFTGGEVFTYDAELLAEDQESLQEVQVYAGLFAAPRVLVKTIESSAFTVPSGGVNKTGTVTVPLADILNALGLVQSELDTLNEFAISITTDLQLTDGSTILASSIVNSGLRESQVFFPVHNLIYFAKDVSEFLPVATISAAKNKALKGDTVETFTIEYDIEIGTAPTVSISPVQGVLGTLTAISGTEYEIDYTAPTGFTGVVTLLVSGGVAGGGPPLAGLVQEDVEKTITIDNTPPQLTGSVTTGSTIGRDQFRDIVVVFNEALSKASGDALKVKIERVGLETVDTKMNISSNGTTASLTYIWKEDADPLTTTTHGPLTITFTGGKDVAGNAVDVTALNASASLISDLGTPPAPTLVLDPVEHNLGTQIKWTATQTTGVNNPGGSTKGTIYYVAVDQGSAAPTSFGFDSEGNAAWGMATNVINRQQGSRTSSGVAFSPFTAKGTFDIYAVFISDTGNESDITAAPQIAGVVMD